MGGKRKITWELIEKNMSHKWENTNRIAKRIGVTHQCIARFLNMGAALGLIEKSRKKYWCPSCGAAFDKVARVDNPFALYRLSSSSDKEKNGGMLNGREKH